jgi:Spy/CpxP family protein refolding chaperone
LKNNPFEVLPMKFFMRRHLLPALFVLTAVGPLYAQAPPPPGQSFPWWKSEPFRKELGLTADQSAHIEKIWESTRPELRQEWDELTKLEAKLSKMIQNDADEAVLARQIDRVETARANANKTRSLMLVQMVKVLSPDQRVRFKGLHDRWLEDIRKQPPVPRKPDEPRKPE